MRLSDYQNIVRNKYPKADTNYYFLEEGENIFNNYGFYIVHLGEEREKEVLAFDQNYTKAWKIAAFNILLGKELKNLDKIFGYIKN